MRIVVYILMMLITLAAWPLKSLATGTVPFTSQTPMTLIDEIGDRPESVAVGDVNGDGIIDFVTANSSSDDVAVLLGNTSGGFFGANQSPFNIGDSPISVVLGDVNDDGFPDIVTANQGSNDVSVLLGDGGANFSPAPGTPFAVGDSPASVMLGDIDGDSILDLVTANRFADNVSVLIGNGNGSFVESVDSPFDVGRSPSSVVLGDVDSDGSLDLISGNDFDEDVSVLLGDGTGGFASAADSPFPVDAGFGSPQAVTLGDMNADGMLDIITANDSGDVSVLLANGIGGYSSSAGSPFEIDSESSRPEPSSIALGDLNGDNTLDVVIANGRNSSDISLFLGDGSGELAPAAGSPFPVGNRPSSVALMDINASGDLDLIIANRDSDDINILLGDGEGVFSNAADSPVSLGGDPFGLAMGDVNSDGISDAVVSLVNQDAILVLRGQGNGRFQAFGPPVPVGGDAPVRLTMDDVNQDGIMDIITANNLSRNLSVLLGDGSGQFVPSAGSSFSAGRGVGNFALGDVDNNGTSDIVAISGNDVLVLLGDGNGEFTVTGETFPTDGSFVQSIALADVDANGTLDAVTTNRFSDDISVLLGNGAGGFSLSPGSPLPVGDDPTSVALGDVNGDGFVDVVTTNSISDDISVMIGDGSGGFEAAPGSPFMTGDLPFSLVTADIDGDGNLDVVTANFNSGDASVLLGDGNGVFMAASDSPFSVGSGPLSIALNDVDGDGISDVVVVGDGTRSQDETLSVLTTDVLFEDSGEDRTVE